MLRKTLAAAALLAGAAFLPQAANAAPAYVVETTAMHAGPDFDYPTVRVIHDGRGVFINGCLDDWSWCDVSFHEDRGWVPGDDLAADYNGGRAGIVSIAPLLGIGILSFSFDDYWGRYYRGRPFYSDRGHWRSYSSEHHGGGSRPEHSNGRPDAFRGGVRGDEGHGRPAEQQRQQVQQDHHQAPENHANIPSQPRAEHQNNRPASPERQQAAPAQERGFAPHPQPAAPQHQQAAPAQERAPAPQQHEQQQPHGQNQKKDDDKKREH